MIRGRAGLFVLHLAGNGLLLWLGYYWLGLPESDARHLLWSALVVLAVIAGAAWLHGTALAHFSGLRLGQAAGRSARNLLPLVVLCLVALAIYWTVLWVEDRSGHAAYVIGSYSTMKLRKPVSPTGVGRVVEGIFWVVKWVVIPVILLPVAAAVAVRGWSWRGSRNAVFGQSADGGGESEVGSGSGVQPILEVSSSLTAGRAARLWRPGRRGLIYWIEVTVLLVLAIWVPLQLFFWVPRIASFGGQMVSFVLRVGVGYLLFAGAVLCAEFFTARVRGVTPNKPAV